MKKEITYDDYDKVQILVGTVLEVSKNEKARKPSLVLKVDFGPEKGVKQTSAQITHYYNSENLVGKQVIGVCNFPKKNIAGIISEVLILGAIEKDGKVVLIHPSQKTENGLENQQESRLKLNKSTTIRIRIHLRSFHSFFSKPFLKFLKI